MLCPHQTTRKGTGQDNQPRAISDNISNTD